MYGYEIIQELSTFIQDDDLIVSCNGNISRQAYHYLPRPQVNLRGSMGLAIPVGLGLALAQPKRRVITILGDGNFLMGVGALATTSYVHPNNLRILILDNNSYATTGHQQTTSSVINYSSLLEGFGLPGLEPINLDDPVEAIREKISAWINSRELQVLAALIASKPPQLDNIPFHPHEITEQFHKKIT